MGLFITITFALFLGFFVILLISLGSREHDAGSKQSEQDSLLSFKRFTRVSIDLVEALKLDITEIEENLEQESLDIYAKNPKPYIGGEFLIHAVLCTPETVISAADIVELSNAVIQGRLSKGWFITTGQFTSELPTISELAPMEFIDGQKLEELTQQFKIPLAETK